MKKLMTLLFTFAVAFSLAMPMFAQETETTTKTTKTTTTSKKLVTLHGTVSADGKTFTDDTDQKAWTVQNPDALKAHEGHHVSVRAHAYADKGEIHVSSAKMLKAPKAKK